MQSRIQEYSNVLGMTKDELLNELRGYYKPSFFYIYLEGDFNINMESLSIKDRGTFVHEYIHYIQNISTYWGLYCSIVRYQELTEFNNHLIASEEINVPCMIERSERLRNKIDRVIFGNGLSIFSDQNSWNIDTEHKIIIEKDYINLHGVDKEIINLSIKFEDQRVERIHLGAHIIKESMAAMYQSLMDSDAIHDDVPYNLVKILCQQHFSNISHDIEKLICICYTSLFSMSPGSELISLLEMASANPTIDGVSIFTEFIDSKTILTCKGKEYSIVEYFHILIEEFKKALATNLEADLDYIYTVLERISLANRGIPYLTILYDTNKLSVENLNALVGYLGIPYIQTLNNGCHFPQSTKEGATENDASSDVLEIITREVMFSYVTNPRRDKICPLYYMCGDTTYKKDGCFGAPWEEPLCLFTVVSSAFSMEKKRITWNF